MATGRSHGAGGRRPGVAREGSTVQRSERLIKLLELLHGQPGMDAEALAGALGVSTRTLQRDLDDLGSAGFSVYFERGYRLAAPALVPAITLTVDQALALSLAARSAAPRAELATARALAVAAQKLAQALAAPPPEERQQRQLALELPVQDPRIEACTAALTEAIADQRTVRLALGSGSGAQGAPRRMDPYRLLPSADGFDLLGYCHVRRRLLRLPVARLQSVSVLQRRFRPVPARLLERHLHAAQGVAPQVQWIRLLARPPLAQALRKYPPVGTLMWERGPDGTVIFMIAAQRPGEFLPWILSCGDAVEILEPSGLRQEVARVARAVATRYAAKPAPEVVAGA